MSLHKRRRRRVKKTERGSTPTSPHSRQSETKSLRVDAERRISPEKRVRSEENCEAEGAEARRPSCRRGVFRSRTNIWSYGCFQTRGETAEDKMLGSGTDRRTVEDRRTEEDRKIEEDRRMEEAGGLRKTEEDRRTEEC